MRHLSDIGSALVDRILGVAVTGVLAGAMLTVAVPTLIGQAAQNACDADRRIVTIAVETFRTLHNDVPSDVADLVEAGLVASTPSLTLYRNDPSAQRGYVLTPASRCSEEQP
jgi:competence protein ComGC